MDIAETQARVIEYAKAKGWYKDGRTFGDHISLIHREVSEALEEFRSNHLGNELYFEYDENGILKPEGVPTELADTIIRVLHLCDEYSIDIEEALTAKLDYNDKRAYRHGGKLL